MVDFSKVIKGKYGTKSFQEIKNTYDWIVIAANKLQLSNLKIASHFLFNVGDIVCSTDGITEFIEHAYGSSNFKINSFQVYIYDENKLIISVSYLLNLSIRSSSKTDLEKFVTILNNTSIDEKNNLPPVSVTYIEAHESATVVAGKNNIVNSTNAIINEPIKESKIKQWFRPIIQNILSNGIWYILTMIGTFLITKYFT